MQPDKNTKRIIELYFGKNFSRHSRILFGRWLRSEEDASHKTELLQELWRQTPADATDTTRADWESLRNSLPEEPSLPKNLPLYSNWIKYAAVAVLVLLTAATTFWLTDRSRSDRYVEMAELFVPYGESRLVTLPDSSKVWLNAGSLLVYPKNFENTDSRIVYLTGEASFSVQKNPDKPFIVKTTYLDVRALGTVFVVESYPEDSCTMATLEEGSVQVSVIGESHKPSILKPDQQLVYSHHANTVNILDVDASLYKMERSGYLIFENATFSRVVASLERKFNVTIHYNSQKYAAECYNVKFAPNESLEDVLDVLHQLIGIHYKIKGNVVFIN